MKQGDTLPVFAIENTKKQFFQYWWIPVVIVVLGFSTASFVIEPYLAYVATSWIIFGLLGLSLDLVWGRAGILSLGQTAFYGLGGYVGSIAAINFAPITGNSLIWALPFGALTGLATSTLVGWFIFYGRMGSLPSTILTYTVTLLLWTTLVSFTAQIGDAVVGGDNGMSNIPGFIIGFGETAIALEANEMFLVVVLISAAVYFLAQTVIRSPFGLVIDCIRLDPVKTELLGYDTRQFQLLLFMFSGAIAGIAGALFGAWANYLNPSIFSVQEALLVPVYVLVGGLGTLVGPFIGALAVGGLSFWLGSGVIGGQTTLIVGVCLILLILFLKKGILGGLKSAFDYLENRADEKEYASVQEFGVQVNFDLLHQLRAQHNRESGTILETVNALKSFGGVTPVDRISQTFAPGQVRCVIGPNGAGKSTYLKACTGTYKLDAGHIFLGGKDITKVEPFRRTNLGLGIKMQKAQVFGEISVRQNLWIAAYSRRRDKNEANRIANDILNMLGMIAYSTRLASDLSHGEQQWLDIGMVLCLSPDVILLDEPAAGMTKKERRQLSELVCVLVETATVIIVEHDMDFVRTLGADVTVLNHGSVFAQGSIEDLRKDERILDIYLGRRSNIHNL